MNSVIAKIIPFILLGIAIVAFAFGLILLFYLFILGAIVGLVLFSINWIKERFFSSQQIAKRKENKKQGRIIDHKD